MTDREQIRRERVEKIHDRLSFNVRAYGKAWTGEFEDTEFLVETLLAELEQAERKVQQLSEWYNDEDRKTRDLKARLAKADKLAKSLRRALREDTNERWGEVDLALADWEDK